MREYKGVEPYRRLEDDLELNHSELYQTEFFKRTITSRRKWIYFFVSAVGAIFIVLPFVLSIVPIVSSGMFFYGVLFFLIGVFRLWLLKRATNTDGSLDKESSFTRFEVFFRLIDLEGKRTNLARLLFLTMVGMLTVSLSTQVTSLLYIPLYIIPIILVLAAVIWPISVSYYTFRKKFQNNTRGVRTPTRAWKSALLFLTLGLLGIAFTCVAAFSTIFPAHFLLSIAFLDMHFQAVFIIIGIVWGTTMLIGGISKLISYPTFTSPFVIHLHALETLSEEFATYPAVNHNWQRRYDFLCAGMANAFSFQKLLKIYPSFSFLPLQNSLLTGPHAEANFQRLLLPHAEWISRALVRMQASGPLDDRMQANFEGVCDAIAQMQALGLDRNANAQTNFDRLIAKAPYAKWIAKALFRMQQSGLELGQANFDRLMTHAPRAEWIYAALWEMRFGLAGGFWVDAYPQANLDCLMAQAPHAKWVSKALVEMRTAGLMTNDHAQANLDCLMAQAPHAKWVSKALVELRTAGLMTNDHAQANFDRLMAQAPHTEWVSKMLLELRTAGLMVGAHAQTNFEMIYSVLEQMQAFGLVTGAPGRANLGHFGHLLIQASHIQKINGALLLIPDLMIGAHAQANFKRLLDHASYAEDIGVLLSKGLMPDGLAQVNFERLLDRAPYAGEVDRTVEAMQKAGSLLAGPQGQKNFMQLIVHAGQNHLIKEVLVDVLPRSLHTQQNFEQLIQQIDHIADIVHILSILLPILQRHMLESQQKQVVIQATLDELLSIACDNPTSLSELSSGLKALADAGLLNVGVPSLPDPALSHLAPVDPPLQQEVITWDLFYFNLLKQHHAYAAGLGQALALLQRRQPTVSLQPALPFLCKYPAHAQGMASMYIAGLVTTLVEGQLPEGYAKENNLLGAFLSLPDAAATALAPILQFLQGKNCLGPSQVRTLIDFLQVSPSDIAEHKNEEKVPHEEKLSKRSKCTLGAFNTLLDALQQMEIAERAQLGVHYFTPANVDLLLACPPLSHAILVNKLNIRLDFRRPITAGVATITKATVALLSRSSSPFFGRLPKDVLNYIHRMNGAGSAIPLVEALASTPAMAAAIKKRAVRS